MRVECSRCCQGVATCYVVGVAKRRSIPKPDPNPNPNLGVNQRTGERWVWVDGEPFPESEVRGAAGFTERSPEADLQKRREKKKGRGSAMSQIGGVRSALKGDSLRGLTPEAGTGSLLRGLTRFIAGK